jgi:UDP-2-acetamido-3-amino-2,3-dideoxy-glucuronate N-acetyltransferase
MGDALPAVAVLGCGRWGRNHLRVCHELGCLRVACDIDARRTAEARDHHPGVATDTDPNAVLARSDVDAVIIATPAASHAALALQAITAGKDVLVEKPMALNAAEGREVVEAAARRGVVLAVGHVLEYHPAVRKLAELVSEGVLGKVRYLYSNRLNLGHIRTEENALWSFSPHDIAVMLRLIGAAPSVVACNGGAYINFGVADFTLTSLRFPGDVLAHIFVSWLHPFKEHRFVVVGNRQMAVFDDTAAWEDKLVLYPHQVDWLSGRIPVAHKAQAVRVPLEQAEPLELECREFLSCIGTREPPLTDGSSGLEVLRILELAQSSLEKAGVPLSGRGAGGADTFVHPTAEVDAGAELGEGTRVWHYTHVMPEARIGRNCVLGQNVFVGRGVRIGDGVKVQNNVSIYEGVELEDHVFCGPSVVFTNVLDPRSEIDKKSEYRKTIVRRGATLGANSTLVCGTTVGRYAFVGAGAVVNKDVPDHALVLGVPARIAGWVCKCGSRLHAGICPACGKTYLQTAEDGVEPAGA